MKLLSRYLAPKILAALEVSPIVFVNGPRQVGKSTLMHLLNSDKQKSLHAEYISFDKPVQLAAATNTPYEFLSSYQTTLIIDEVQLAPEIFSTLKVVVDELRLIDKSKANGRFLLTGSANILTLPKLTDALVGRMVTVPLLPFAVSEVIASEGNAIERLIAKDFSHLSNKKLSLFDAINYATFPEISQQKTEIANIWFDGYLTTMLQRDVRMLADITKISLLPTVLKMLAARAGNILNYADISRDLKLNPVTTKLYCDILQMMFLSFMVRPWFSNINKRLVKSPKGYFIDTRMLGYVLGYSLAEIKQHHPSLIGHIIENFVATELTKLLSFSKVRAELYYFRTSDGKEVDFVLECANGKIVAIEVKASETVTLQDFRGIHELASHTTHNFICGIVLYQGQTVVAFGKNLWAVPLYFLWQ